MFLKIKDDYDFAIITFESNQISEKEVSSLRDYLSTTSTKKRVAIDLANISSVDNTFFSLIKEYSLIKQLSLFNLSADINLLLFIMNYGKFANLYVNEMDFCNCTRELVNRNFRFCVS